MDVLCLREAFARPSRAWRGRPRVWKIQSLVTTNGIYVACSRHTTPSVLLKESFELRLQASVAPHTSYHQIYILYENRSVFSFTKMVSSWAMIFSMGYIHVCISNKTYGKTSLSDSLRKEPSQKQSCLIYKCFRLWLRAASRTSKTQEKCFRGKSWNSTPY